MTDLLSLLKKPLNFLCLAAFFISFYMIFLYAPIEMQEGVVQKIMYFHIPQAWCAFGAFFLVFCFSILFLWKKDREWDIYANSAAEVGIIFCSLVLITGPIWAKPVWGVWWTWDARLTLTLVLWFIYAAYLMLRAQSLNPSMKAKYCAVLGIVGFLDVPLIHFSVLWWRTMHPQPKVLVMTGDGPGSGMPPEMLITLLSSVIAFTLLFFVLFNMRNNVEKLKDEIEHLKTL